MCANCHVVSVQIEMNNLTALENACKRLGWQFCEGQTDYKWYGRWVDDSPVPKHIFPTVSEYQDVLNMDKQGRKTFMTNYLGHCDHAIKVPGCNYEIGILDMGDNRLVPVWDWYDSKLNSTLGQSGDKLVQAYAVERARLEAQANGYMCQEQQLKDGSIQLRVQLGDL